MAASTGVAIFCAWDEDTAGWAVLSLIRRGLFLYGSMQDGWMVVAVQLSVILLFVFGLRFLAVVTLARVTAVPAESDHFNLHTTLALKVSEGVGKKLGNRKAILHTCACNQPRCFSRLAACHTMWPCFIAALQLKPEGIKD